MTKRAKIKCIINERNNLTLKYFVKVQRQITKKKINRRYKKYYTFSSSFPTEIHDLLNAKEDMIYLSPLKKNKVQIHTTCQTKDDREIKIRPSNIINNKNTTRRSFIITLPRSFFDIESVYEKGKNIMILTIESINEEPYYNITLELQERKTILS